MKEKATAQPQWMKITRGIRSAIERGDLRPGERLGSETDLAAQWKVSPVTAHKAMQELQREGWVIRKRRVGTVVAERTALPARRIAMVFTDLAAMPQAGYARGIRDALPEEVKLTPFDIRGDARREADCLKQILAGNEADGLVCYATCDPANIAIFRDLSRKIPLIFVDRLPTGLEKDVIQADAVMTDNAGSIRAGLELLHTRGHRRIAYFMEDAAPFVSSISERLSGYRQFMTEVVDEEGDRWVRTLARPLPVPVYFARVQEELELLLQGPEPVTAVCCQQDKLLAAVLEACVHLQVSVPGELEVLSFSDLPAFLQPLGRSVHRLVQRSSEMGGMAARRLMLRLENPELPIHTMRLLADLHPATTVVPSNGYRLSSGDIAIGSSASTPSVPVPNLEK